MEPSGSEAGRAGTAQGGEGPAAVRVRPTQQGRVYLWTLGVFSATLWLLGENLVFLLGTLGLGCGAVAWFLARRNLQRVRFERELPRRTRVGAPTPVAWVAHARGRAALGLEVDDPLARGARPARLAVEFPAVRPGQPARGEARVRFARRGIVDLGRSEVRASSRYPLGLFRARVRVAGAGRLLVRPREGRPTSALRARLRGRRPAEVRRRLHARGDDVIHGVREYREGDDPRRVHWRSTARRGALVVTDWRAEHGREALVVLGRGQGAGRASAAAFERAVSAAATVWRACQQEGLRARLVLGGARECRLGEGGRGLGGGLDALARVASQGRRQPRSALQRHAKASGPRTVVYVAADAEDGVERELARAAGPAGSWLLLRAGDASLTRWIRGLP